LSATPRRGPWRELRILALLVVLFTVALKACVDRERSTDWNDPLFVALYPIAADDSAVTQDYIARLDDARYAPIDEFFSREAARYGVTRDRPVRIRRKAAIGSLPPGRNANDGPLVTAAWSLRLRYWAWKQTRAATEPADIELFVLYHDPALTPSVPHSLGLAKGLLGVVYAFADHTMDGPNNVVIAHELMHTLGATDKYDVATDLPLFPDGYGDPKASPLYPQTLTELMGGRRMVTPNEAEMPLGLAEVVIGPRSAAEIRLADNAKR
jgi:hypothetical protein